MENRLSLFKVFMSPLASKNLEPVLNSGFITQGKKVEEFEKTLQEWFDYPYILTLNSATSGLSLALRLGFNQEYLQANNLEKNQGSFQKGDTVLCSALTCFATVVPILAHHLNIVWVDTDNDTGNVCLKDLERKMSEIKNIKAMCFVHWAGSPLDLDKIRELQEKYHKEHGYIPRMIEDCAHSFGAEYKGRKLGSHCADYGNIAVFSLQAIKHLTTGDGGLIFLPDQDSYERAKLMRWYGIDRNARSNGKDFRLEKDILEWGYKYHMNDISATIGLSNLPFMKGILEKVRRNAAFYDQSLKLLDGVEIMKQNPDSLSAYWIYTIKIKAKESFIQFADKKGIMVSQVHNRVDKHSCVKKFRSPLPNLDKLEKEIVCIPCGWWMEIEDCERVKNMITEFIEQTRFTGLSIRRLRDFDFYRGFLDVLTQLNGVKIDISPEEGLRKLIEMEQQNSKVLVAVIGDKIIGTGKILIETKFYENTAHIEDVVVDKDFRNKKVGYLLIQHLVKLAEESGVYKVVLECNDSLIPFYHKCNFQDKGRQMVKYFK